MCAAWSHLILGTTSFYKSEILKVKRVGRSAKDQLMSEYLFDILSFPKNDYCDCLLTIVL